MNKLTDEKDNLRIREVSEVYRGVMLVSNGHVIVRDRASECFVYVMEGSAVYYFEYGSIEVSTGDVLFIPCGSNYGIDILSDYRFIYVDFLFYTNKRFFAAKVSNVSELETTFRNLLAGWMRKSSARMLICYSCLYAIYGEFLSQCLDVYISSGSRQFINQAEEMIDRQLGNPSLSTEYIARELKISAAYLRKLFNMVFGVPPHKYILRLRIQKARILLSEDQLKIKDIAEMCGFSSVFYFNRVFSKATGIPPGEFRKDNTQ